jgi:hypothetical protein
MATPPQNADQLRDTFVDFFAQRGTSACRQPA